MQKIPAMPTIDNSSILATEQGVSFVLNYPVPQGGLNGKIHVKLNMLNISSGFPLAEITINGPITESSHKVLLPFGDWGNTTIPTSYNLQFVVKVNDDPEVDIPVTVTRGSGTFDVTVNN